MIFITGGNVGIGKTGPLNKLQVEGSIALASSYTGMGVGERYVGIPAGGATWAGAGAYIGFTQGGTGGVSNELRFYTHKSGISAGERMRIDEAGNVTGTYGNYHVSSDIRNKTDIATIPNALDKVLALRGVNFRWKDGSDNGSLQMGMIAQEAELIVPGLFILLMMRCKQRQLSISIWLVCLLRQ